VSRSSRPRVRQKPAAASSRFAKDNPSRGADAARATDSPPSPQDGTTAAHEPQRPGEQLMALLFARAQQLGHTGRELANCLGVSAGHLQLLRSGARDPRKIGPELVTAAAAYTGLSRVQVMQLAGQITAEDFGCMSHDAQLAKAITFILSDPPWGSRALWELHSSSPHTKRLVIQMYEAATGYKLLLEPKNRRSMGG
jgi:hypothetical protein